jgi:hypothetical protein
VLAQIAQLQTNARAQGKTNKNLVLTPGQLPDIQSPSGMAQAASKEVQPLMDANLTPQPNTPEPDLTGLPAEDQARVRQRPDVLTKIAELQAKARAEGRSNINLVLKPGLLSATDQLPAEQPDTGVSKDSKDY